MENPRGGINMGNKNTLLPPQVKIFREPILKIIKAAISRPVKIDFIKNSIHILHKKNQIKFLNEVINIVEIMKTSEIDEASILNLYLGMLRGLAIINHRDALALSIGNEQYNNDERVKRSLVIYNLRASKPKAVIEILNTMEASDWASKKRLEAAKIINLMISEEGGSSGLFNTISSKKGTEKIGVNIASILDVFSNSCFNAEVNLYPLPREGWQQIFIENDISFFFAESSWNGNNGEWQYAFTSFNKSHGDELRNILKLCKKLGIPSIFWNKEDPINYDAFIDVAKEFDIIFTTDERCVYQYQIDCKHDLVYPLPFAAQPLIHNPVRNTLPLYDVSFIGSWYIRKHGSREDVLNNLIDGASNHNLHIYDRNFGTDNRNQFPEKYHSLIRGRLTYEECCMAYRSYKAILNVNSVDDSMNMFSRRVYEILCSATNVISGPSIGMESMFSDGLHVCHSKDDVDKVLTQILSNDFFRTRSAHLAHRNVMMNHTYRQRMEYILETIGIAYEKQIIPKVSVVTITNRTQFFDKLFSNFNQQTHPNKNLILVLHGDEADWKSKLKGFELPKDTKVLNAPSDWTLGKCTALGFDNANGDFIAKMDDDDWYGPNYLADGIMPFSYTDAMLVGKNSVYLYHQGHNKLFLKNPGKSYRYIPFVYGPTFIFRKKALEILSFADKQTGEDTDILRQAKENNLMIYSTDPFNFVMNRRNDGTHTWQVEDEELLKNTKVQNIDLKIEDIMI